MPFHASIAGAKGAVEGLTKSLAAEFAPKIRVNAIAPSLTQTPLADKLLNAEAKIIAAGDRHPLKKIGQAKNITQAVHYLLQNDWVTGQILAVDGGMSTLSNG
jgi:NAD(P)-dependent dehydrogenase (short-subunit alcohol dehydrogenase family)